jgi:peroxiredoxin
MKYALVSILFIALAVLALAGEATGPQLEPGAKAPPFTLKGIDGKTHSLDELKGERSTVVVFTCNHCPFAQAYEDRLISLAKSLADKGVRFVAINANDPAVSPDDSFEKMADRAKEKGFPYPYLFDATQEVAKAYGAQVTPHVFVFDSGGVLRYRGRVDDNAKTGQVTSPDLKNALEAVLAGKPVPTAATTAFGCSVKWKKQA